ncbi:uncharacterized protein LOC115682198 isoform X1 [Syzygium oleosum]|uniref:uncharacterized protein LOC115682198 isoform X1 n=1 Tax=Syzygium oleosum TaxID=219896 RepID=UPI0024BA36DC|nr:uncharacterized protein LOC115682198 isoform X1 [Syzygium oleosum]XP_056168956.1 uncharacterized protein LOC115682198 isoform X1 [Syzygium oleosum]
MAATKMSLKLLVDKRNQTVLFAEARKDFVDFLFHCLALPVGTIMSLLTKAGTVGGFGNLYMSVENLGDTYITPREKDALLNPKAQSAGPDVLLLLLPEAPPSVPINYYTCPRSDLYNVNNSCRSCVTGSPSTRCPGCNDKMSKKMSWVVGPAADAASSAEVPGGEGGYVSGVMYMVMDDLVVKPMSPISGITLLKRFNVHEIEDLEEKVVDFGLDEAIKLLNASLHSKTVLTDIFCRRKSVKRYSSTLETSLCYIFACWGSLYMLVCKMLMKLFNPR